MHVHIHTDRTTMPLKASGHNYAHNVTKKHKYKFQI